MVSGFQEKKEGEVRTVALNLTLKIANSSCPLPQSLLSERALRSARAFRREGSSEVGRRRADVGIGPYKKWGRWYGFAQNGR